MRGQILSVTMRRVVLWATQAREKTKPRDIEWFFCESKLSSAAEKNLPGYVFKSVLVFQKTNSVNLPRPAAAKYF